MPIAEQLAQELHIRPQQAASVIELLDEGNTIPFIARYRKERTGSLDDQVLRELAERLEYLRNLADKRESIAASLEQMDKLTDELRAALEGAKTLAELEDIYRPYRPRRRTRAMAAREKGLEPLARLIAAGGAGEQALQDMARKLTDPEKGVADTEEAMAGALDILAEEISDRADIRKNLRDYLAQRGTVHTVLTDEAPDSPYAMYADRTEPVRSMAPHRILAMDRGEREDKLKVTLEADREEMFLRIRRRTVPERASHACADRLEDAARDSLARLIFPSLDREVRAEMSDRAQESAIRVFSLNLKNLLMQPPLKGKVALGFDPAYRTGCKLAVVDGIGRVLDTGVIYPTPPQNKTREAAAFLKDWIARYGIQVIALGNGTASRESEEFLCHLLEELPAPRPAYMVVSEAGASVYSASPLGAAEFPGLDVSLRSAVSIARRMQDPLCELVKIDPKSLGVGQYQHDVKPARLSASLDGVVESCVNNVGADLNRASVPLLSAIAGITPSVAANIVAYREENGPFTGRSQLKKVPKLGPKAFQQCAGFLRIVGAKDVLDGTGVHPESYPAARALLEACGYSAADVRTGALTELTARVEAAGWGAMAERLGIGEPTLRDIVQELLRPGRDPRDELPPPLLRTGAMELSQLTPGMELQGVVRNVTDFGAFVDIGVHQDGLVHISQMGGRFLKHPGERVKVGDTLRVWVLSVDTVRRRIGLTMVDPAGKDK